MKTYFIVYKMQRGQTIPAYSYVNKATLETIQADVIDWKIEVETKAIRTPEETDAYLGQYKRGQA